MRPLLGVGQTFRSDPLPPPDPPWVPLGRNGSPQTVLAILAIDGFLDFLDIFPFRLD